MSPLYQDRCRLNEKINFGVVKGWIVRSEELHMAIVRLPPAADNKLSSASTPLLER